MLHKFQHGRSACEQQQTGFQLAATKERKKKERKKSFVICIAFEVMQGAMRQQVQIVPFVRPMSLSSRLHAPRGGAGTALLVARGLRRALTRQSSPLMP